MDKNNLFYLCSLIESISRTTHLSKKETIQYFDKDYLIHLYNVAEINHSLPIKQVTDEVISHQSIPYKKGTEHPKIPTVWDIGKVYSRLIRDISNETNWSDQLIEVYNSWICDDIDNYHKPIYWQSRSYIKECYLQHHIL